MLIEITHKYIDDLTTALGLISTDKVAQLVELLIGVRKDNKKVLICGNGGSAANAMHIANDFTYGVEPNGASLKAEALSANSAILTCLGNDLGYENIFSHQIKVKGDIDDCLIVLSGSGNSPNILAAIEQAKLQGLFTVAILGYDGGLAKISADLVFHFDVNDMQVAEDTQLVIGHILMKVLNEKIRNETIHNETIHNEISLPNEP